jgi:methylenetetrahydrofolate dehydrogenase (NADP+)/methenyltetrahydrofolate cyclohydrolase
MHRNCTVTTIHTRTKDPMAYLPLSDLIICAAGVLNSVRAEHVAPGQTVIDVSMNWNPEKITAKGKGGMCGDAIFDEVEPIVEAITPVPGGVGAVTTSVLMKHVVEAAEKV